MLLCLAGLDVQELFETLDDDKDTYEEALQALNNYFAPRKNIPYERYQFLQLKQNIFLC